jgi:hypothetical protein
MEPTNRSTHARPSDNPAELKTREERVDFIAEVMTALKWERGKSGPPLARLWGVTEATVRDYAAEASRRVTADAEEVRREITVRGLGMLRAAHHDGQARDFAALGKLLADVSGANAPAKHEVLAGTLEPSPAEAARLVRERFGGHAMKDDDEAGNAEPSGDGGLPSDATKT